MTLLRTASALALGLGLSLAACSPQAATENPPPVSAPAIVVSDASVAADPVSGALRLTWSTSEPAPVTVSVTGDGLSATPALTPLAQGVTATDFTWTPEPGFTGRPYFVITPPAGDAVTVAARVLPLEGGRNFRDLGGYPAADGQTVRWGRLYRSGVMAGLTDADYAYLDSLGIKVVCDLRTSAERANEPTEWRAAPVTTLSFPDPEASDEAALGRVLMDPQVTPEAVKAMMTGFYATILEQQAPAYRDMFDRLAANEVPLAFHCSAGKDRTGVGAALILSALGVPRETIVADYVLSDQLVDYRKAMQLDQEAGKDDPYAFLRQLPPEVVAPLLASDAAYIEATFAQMEAQHGSVEAYLKAELDVTDEDLAALRANLLE